MTVAPALSPDGAKTLFVISDLHMGDGGPRDNFAHDHKEQQLDSFLNYVTNVHGELLILGDLFEFWKANLGRVLTHRRSWLDRLGDMQATYVLGNHDAELQDLIGSDLLNHRLFSRMQGPFNRQIGSRTFRFLHGHETDPIYRNGNPGWANVFAIVAGIMEDRRGTPLMAQGGTAEKFWGRIGRQCLWIWNAYGRRFDRRTMRSSTDEIEKQLTPAQNPRRLRGMLKQYRHERTEHQVDAIVSGHTHQPRCYKDWYYNSGCWIGNQNNFLQIAPDGRVTLYNWQDGFPVQLSG